MQCHDHRDRQTWSRSALVEFPMDTEFEVIDVAVEFPMGGIVEFSMVDTVEFSMVESSSVLEVTVVKFSMVDMV